MDSPLVPYKQIVHDRLNLEIARGCTRGCRFCQAGIIYRPVRERNLENLRELAESALKKTGYSDLSLSSLSTGDYSCIGELLGALMEKCAPQKIAVSLPSLRSETLIPDLMEGIKKVRKTGFTIAPEAGTQRLRDIINKGITEDEILTTVDNVFDAGWNAIKLYFMVGLPDEREEDLKGIVNLSRKVLSLTRRGKKRRKVNVSVSTFVPKAHTPFQWVPQISLDVMRAKQGYLKEEIRKLRLTFKWQDVYMSYLEGIFARGDRRLSKVIEKAWRLGCRFDGWSDQLEWDYWQEALTGIDQDFYTTRRRLEEEVFPWEHIDTGVEKSFLWEEYQRGLKGDFTPDCRTASCQQCGVCDNSQLPVKKPVSSGEEGDTVDEKASTTAVHGDRSRVNNHPEGYHRIRVKFAKMGKARFLSHLELLAVFSRALRRAGIPLRFSEGFHPLPRIVLGPALPVGFESRAEYLDLQVLGVPNSVELAKVLNFELPEWLRVLESDEIPLKFPSISDSIIGVKYRVDLSNLDPDPSKITLRLEEGIRTFSRKADNYLKIKHKSGSSLVDLKEWIEDLSLRDNTTVEMLVKMKGGKTVRPFEILQAVFGLTEDEKGKSGVLKTDAAFRVGPFQSA
jgi:radical SAM-linked protein